MHVGGAEAELARARAQEDALGGVEFLELLRDEEGVVWAGVVDYYDFPVEVVRGEGAVEEPD